MQTALASLSNLKLSNEILGFQCHRRTVIGKLGLNNEIICLVVVHDLILPGLEVQMRSYVWFPKYF